MSHQDRREDHGAIPISEWNYVTKELCICPTYKPNPRNQRIDFYIGRNNDLVLVGQLDNNYVYWFSVTTTEDEEKNEAIFNFISSQEHPEAANATHLNQALKSTRYSYEDLKGMFRGSLTRTAQPGMAWQTPFGHFYSWDEGERNGRYFAKDIGAMPDKIRERCQAREADGRYLPVLQRYLDILKADQGNPMYYCQVESLVELIRSEDYLVLSQRDEIRAVYLELIQTIGSLYNSYMTVAR